MKVYFLSSVPAILKLDGEYVGVIDCFLRCVELNTGAFVEVVPQSPYNPINFFIDKGIYGGECEFCDVYTMGCDILLNFNSYTKNLPFKVLFQRRFKGNLVTIFALNGVYMGVDGEEYSLTKLDDSFLEAEFEEIKIGEYDLLLVRGGNMIAILSTYGKVVFLNRCKILSLNRELKVLCDAQTCTGTEIESTFMYDGRDMKLAESVIHERFEVDEKLIPFAFFESVMSFGNFEKYLAPDLVARSGEIAGFLGKYVSVICPPQDLKNPNAVGLVYPKGKHLYDVRFFAVELCGGKIENIFEV